MFGRAKVGIIRQSTRGEITRNEFEVHWKKRLKVKQFSSSVNSINREEKRFNCVLAGLIRLLCRKIKYLLYISLIKLIMQYASFSNHPLDK